MNAHMAGTDSGLIEVMRARRDSGKEWIRRDACQDGRLSMKARGILAYLVSKPDVWRTNAAAIAATCDKDGREAIATGLKELEQLGYLVRKRRHGSDGQWSWCWIYSDDPTEVAEMVAHLVPDGAQAARTGSRRGRARAPKSRVSPVNGKSVDGEEDPQVRPIDGFPVDGKPGDGEAARGKPVDIEDQEEKITPPPPRERREQVSRAGGELARCEHGRTACRICGTSPRAQAWAERARLEADRAERERCGRLCSMCVADGKTTDGETRWIRVLPGTQVPVTPYDRCDHKTAHEERMRELVKADNARVAGDGHAPRAELATEQKRGRAALAGKGRAEVRELLASRKLSHLPATGGSRQLNRRRETLSGAERVPPDRSPRSAALERRDINQQHTDQTNPSASQAQRLGA